MKNKKTEKVYKEMLILDLVESYPDLTDVLMEDYGLHCFSCFAAAMETLEQGAMAHGMDENDIKIMVENLNELVDKK
jgi:hybrid cluster-associated redox disulfide protein